MVFGHRSISGISNFELKLLIGKEENQWLEFKLHAYHHSTNNQVDIRKICTDITAMANAEGGYIFIGVKEQTGKAEELVGVIDPDTLVDSIIHLCLPNIYPPIPEVEVEPRVVEWGGKEITLVIIHIPRSDEYPHGFHWEDTINYAIRSGINVGPYDTHLLTYELTNRPFRK